MRILVNFIMVILSSSALHSQTNTIDTVVNGRHFTFVDYYKKGIVKCLGNYQDTLKVADWVYFNKKGRILAFGKYKSNRKFGIWTYYEKKEVRKIKWTDKCPPSEMFEYDSKGNLVLIDVTYFGCFHYYINGSFRMSARPM